MSEDTTAKSEAEAKAQQEAEAKAKQDKACDEEFARRDKERAEMVKAEREAEKNYDTLLVTLSTLAIGSTFTLLKDVIVPEGFAAFLLGAAWFFLLLCLFMALVDRLWTYDTHIDARKILDEEFTDWTAKYKPDGPDAIARAEARFPKEIKRWAIVQKLKWYGFWTLLAGVVFLLGAVIASNRKTSAPAATPVTVNVFAATTQPATQVTRP